MFAQGRGGQAAREITQTRGDLYYVSVGANTVFLVTPDGIILGDPVSTEQATWLKPELERRFNKPVRYIIYSHHDFDHAEGAAVFGPAAHVIAHENVAKNLDGRLHRLAGGNVDSNNNGKLDRDEASGGYLRNFDRLDRNHDGAITPAELNQEIRKPDITYTGRRTLTLGGKTVQLIYPARNHSDDMTVMYVPAERAVLASISSSPAPRRRSGPNTTGRLCANGLLRSRRSKRSISISSSRVTAGGWAPERMSWPTGNSSRMFHAFSFLIATIRSSRVSRAFHTSPIPPAPMGASKW